MGDRLKKRGLIWHGTYYDRHGRARRITTRCMDREAALGVLQRIEREEHTPAIPPHKSPIEAETDKIYFVQAGPAGPIKIGTAKDLPQRMARLQTGNHVPLCLLAWIPGGYALEAEIHRQLAPDVIAGEWFAPSEEVLRRIGSLTILLRGAIPVFKWKKKP